MVVLFGLHWDKRGHTIRRNVGRKCTDKSLEKLKRKKKKTDRGEIFAEKTKKLNGKIFPKDSLFTFRVIVWYTNETSGNLQIL